MTVDPKKYGYLVSDAESFAEKALYRGKRFDAFMLRNCPQIAWIFCEGGLAKGLEFLCNCPYRNAELVKVEVSSVQVDYVECVSKNKEICGK